MIKNILFCTLFIFAALAMNAQEEEVNVPMPDATNTTKFLRNAWISIGGGPRALETQPGSITTYYVDDSPSRDEFYSTIDIKDDYNRVGLNLEIGFAQEFGLSHTIFLDAAVGQSHSTFGGYSAGWELPVRMGKSGLVVRPGFNLMYGNTGFRLGKIQNEDLFIQIDGDRFYDDYLNIRLSENLFVYGPRLDLNFLFPKKHGITASVAYDFSAGSSKPKLFFSAPSTEDRPDDAPTSAIVKITDNNLNINYNGRDIVKSLRIKFKRKFKFREFATQILFVLFYDNLAKPNIVNELALELVYCISKPSM